jgi:hypothetical protein
MSIIEEIAQIKSSDLSDEEKKKKIRKLRRQARVQTINPPQVPLETYYAEVEKEANVLPPFDPKVMAGYAFSLKAAGQTQMTFNQLCGVFIKRFGVAPRKQAVIKLSWDHLLLLVGPEKAN